MKRQPETQVTGSELEQADRSKAAGHRQRLRRGSQRRQIRHA